MTVGTGKEKLFGQALYLRAAGEAFRKLNPLRMVRNPVMFVVEVGSLLTTALWVEGLFGRGEAPGAFIGAIAVWLWFTVLFANFAEAVAEGHGKAQAEALRRTRQETKAKRLIRSDHQQSFEIVASSALHQGDLFQPAFKLDHQALSDYMGNDDPSRQHEQHQ